MEKNEILAFFQSQVAFLQKGIAFPNTSITLMFSGKTFIEENFKDISAFSTYQPKVKNVHEVLDQFVISGHANLGPSNRGEGSTFQSFGTIILMNDISSMNIEFVEESRSSKLFRRFSLTNCTIKWKDAKYQFREIGADWEIGVKLAGLSFLELCKKTEIFIKERCECFKQ